MIKFLADQVMGFVVPNKLALIVVGVLFAGMVTAGVLLKASYKENGVLHANNVQWKIANDISLQAYNDLNQKVLQREAGRADIKYKYDQLRKQLTVVEDDKDCLNTDMPNDLRMLYLPADSSQLP